MFLLSSPVSTGPERTLRPLRNDVPPFGFPAAACSLFVCRSVCIVWVNLDGKFVRRENKFCEKREIAGLSEHRTAPFSGISRQASFREMPENEPVAMRQLTSKSHASPMGSARFALSGKRGARVREPQRRGLNVGSIRKGSGFMGVVAIRAALLSLPLRCFAPNREHYGWTTKEIRWLNDLGRSRFGEEFLDAAQAFFDAFNGGCVGESQVAGCAEGRSGNERNVRFFQKQRCKF